MSLSDNELRVLVPELANALVGRAISNVWQPLRDRVVLGFSNGTLLLLCPRGPDARLHTILRRPKNPQTPFSFQGACRAHIKGPLTQLRQHPTDRVVDLHFHDVRLHLRLTGNAGGLWLLRNERVIAAHDGPAPIVLPPLPSHGPRDLPIRFSRAPNGSWDEAVRQFFQERISTRLRKELLLTVRRGLTRKRSRLARLLQNLDGDLSKSGKSDSLRRQGDALAAVLHTIRRGATMIETPCLSTGELIQIPLRPDRSPADSLNSLYKKARRLDRMGERVLERMEKTEEEIQSIQRRLDGLSDLTTAELRHLRGALSGTNRPVGLTFPGVITWCGPAGERIFVGRDARANRYLSFQKGRGHDYWMHRRGAPGSHVLLKLHRGQTPPLSLLLVGAQFVALHAGIPVGSSIDVQYTRIKDIRSVPGSENANVRVFNEKVLHTTRDPVSLVGWTRL